jgi:hypothetical protein
MRRLVMSLSSLFLLTLSISDLAQAVSPIPEEIERNAENKAIEKVIAEGYTVCSIKIVYAGNLGEDYFAPIVFKDSLSKKAFEKVIGMHEDSLKTRDVCEVTIQCKFPPLESKEQ